MQVTIKWSRQALQQFDTIVSYIEKENASSADKVRTALLSRMMNYRSILSDTTAISTSLTTMEASERLNFITTEFPIVTLSMK